MGWQKERAYFMLLAEVEKILGYMRSVAVEDKDLIYSNYSRGSKFLEVMNPGHSKNVIRKARF